jgi:multiple sugar transport system substrate-binding protein
MQAVHTFKRSWIFLLLIFLAFFSTVTGSRGSISAEEKNVVLSVWSYTEDIKKFADRFMDQSPVNIKVEVTYIPYEVYLIKLKEALASGLDVPDLFLGDAAFIKDIVEGGFWEDLSAEPFKADVKDMVPYVAQVGTDSRGKLRGLSWQACVGGFYYRRSVAKAYLGTDDPQKVGKMLSTPEKFLETARILHEKSEGRVRIIASLEDYKQYLLGARTKAFIDKNKKFELEKPILDFFETAKIMKDEGLILNVQQWGTEWWENLNNTQPDIFGYVLPTWGLQNVIKPNAGDTSGDWGLCKGPASYFWGGSWLGIHSGSQNKGVAWEFLKFVALNQDTLEWWAKESGDFVNSKTVINKIKKNYADDFLAGQNSYEYFAGQALKINGTVISKYDNEISNYLMQAINAFVDGSLTKPKALEDLKANAEGHINTYMDWKKSADLANQGALGEEVKERTVLSVWSFTEELKSLADRFQEQNPEIKIKITVIQYNDYLSKILPRLESGKSAPDVFMGEANHVRKFIEKDYWEDLSRPPYKADVSDMFPFTVQAAKDSGSRLRALCWQVWIGGFFYRRSLAKEYLGTDDPEKIGEMLSSEEKFIATGIKLRDKSGGKVRLLAGWQDYLRYALAMRKNPFVTKDNHFVLDEAVKRLFAVAQVLKKERLTANYPIWPPEWFEGMRKDASIFGYSFGQWGINILKNEASSSGGDWAVCKGPSSFFWGGTWAGIYKNSKNKEAAWKFLQFLTLNRDTLERWAREKEQFVDSKAVMNKLKKEISNEFLGGQKYFQYLAGEALKINGALVSAFDEPIQEILCRAIDNYVEERMSKEAAVRQFKTDVKNAFPELIVE